MATGRDAHIAIDVVPQLVCCPPRGRRALTFFNRAVMAAASFVLVIHGIDYVVARHRRLAGAADADEVLFPRGAGRGRAEPVLPVWPKPGRSLLQGAAIVAGGLALYLAVRYGGPLVYGQAGSAIVLVLVGLVLIVLGVPIAFALAFGAFAAFAPFARSCW
jgi:TRAP-type C4-dicarboxylate transport system permease small subunit